MTRKAIAELYDKIEDKQATISLGLLAVIDSALLRGAITAIQWVLPTPIQVKAVKSMKEAFTQAFAKLEEAGIEPPRDLDPTSYQRPTRAYAS